MTRLEGSSSESWKTNPIRSARSRERVASEADEASSPVTLTTPALGVSSSPSMYTRVDLPRPAGPVSAVTRPEVNSWVSPSNRSSSPRR